MTLFDLSGEVAAVIGGTGVLGGAIAEGLAQAGARVAVIGRNAERGEARARLIQKAGGQSRFIAADAMSRESLRAANEAVEKAFGPATILVNAAGGTDPNATVTAEKPLEQLPLDAWKNNFDLNAGFLFNNQIYATLQTSNNGSSTV